MKRRSLSTLQRVRIFDRAKGICLRCERKIMTGETWQVMHIVSLWAGGADDETNMAPGHVDCHQDQTTAEATQRAKEVRVRAKHLGIKRQPKGRPFPCGRQSAWKKKVSGEVVRR